MWFFDGIQLNDYVTWKELNFQYKKGVTFLHGRNFSGKSITVSSLCPILLDEGSIPQGSTAKFFARKNETPYTFQLQRGAKTSSYSICENEIDKAIHKIATAQKFIRNTFGISSEIFHSTISIGGLKDHPLASGKPSTRLDYLFNTLASSTVYDEYSESIAKVSENLSKRALKLRTLKEMLSHVKSDKVEPSDYDVKEAKENLASLQETIGKLSEKEDNIRRAMEVGEKPKFLYDSESDFKEAISKLRKQLVRIETYEKNKEKAKKVAKALRQFEELKKELKAPDESYEDLSKKVNKQITKTKNLIEDYDTQLEAYENESSIRKLASSKTSTDYTVKQIKEALSKLESSYFHAKSIVEVEAHDEDKCPICLSNMDMSNLRKKASKTLDSYSDRKAILKNDLKILEAKAFKLTEKPEDYKDKWTDKVEKLERFKEICIYLANSDTAMEVKDLGQTSDSVLEKIEKLEQNLSDFIVYEKRIKFETDRNNPFIGLSNLSKRLHKVSEEKSELSAKIAKLSDRIPREEWRKESYLKWHRQYTDLNSQLKEFANDELDIEVVKGLKQAFSRDGYRLHKLREATKLYVSNLNSLTPLLIQEPMKFEAVLDKRKCDILATRNGKVDTIFSFSGAERQIFKMISALALIRCLPSHLRADTIFLDELETNGDEIAVTRYARDFIPELRKSVDKVIVISPKSIKELPVQYDRAFQVVKKAGRSTLIKM